MSTTFPLANPWVDGEALNAVKLAARITTPLNDLAGTDTGWLNITVNAGFAALAGNVAQARRIANRVYFRGAFANTGLAINTAFAGVGTLPAGIGAPPTSAQFWPMASSAGNATGHVVVNTNGAIDLRIGATLGAYYQVSSVTYLTD